MATISDKLNQLANQLWQFAPGTDQLCHPEEVRLVAHRGAHGIGPHGKLIENTLSAFDLCLEHQLWGIELDIHQTLDGELVVHHDPHCGRLFARPDIIIAGIDFQQLRSEIPQIPLLSEVVDRYAGNMHLMIEIKASWRDHPELPNRVEQQLKNLAPAEDFHLLSLVPDYLEGFRCFPAVALMDVAEFNTAEIIRENRELGHGAIAGSFALLTSAKINQLHRENRKIGTGMVENLGVLNREVNRGVEWIFSNSAVKLMSELRAAFYQKTP